MARKLRTETPSRVRRHKRSSVAITVDAATDYDTGVAASSVTVTADKVRRPDARCFPIFGGQGPEADVTVAAP